MALAMTSPSLALPTGCLTAALCAPGSEPLLRIAIVVRTTMNAAFGPFVRLRDMADGSVYLGCLEDAGGRILRWLEVWVQHTENLEATRTGYKAALSNHTLDARWKAMARQSAALDPEGFIETGWETSHPLPFLFEPQSGKLFNPTDSATGKAWELCTDDGRLAAAGLPAYASSLARYLAMHDGKRDHFIPINADAPASKVTIAASEIFGGIQIFNPGGLMLVRNLAPLSFEEWIGILSGEAWDGIPNGRRPVKLGGIYATLGDASAMRHGGGHLLLGARGVGGRLVETCHLKLQTLAAAFRAAMVSVQTAQLPFLNLSASSFSVSLRELDSGLPFLWASQVSLTTPGDAVALPVATTEARYFVPSDFGQTSIYRPPEIGIPVRGRCGWRIRKVLPDSGETTRVEATLVTQERLAASGNDLLWVNLPLPTERIALYGRIETLAGPSRELRFRSEPQKLAASSVAALRQAEGAPFPNVPFELVPMLSSPCDLYALGVLAVRTLLVDGENTLPVALDELHSLARSLVDQAGNLGPLASRVEAAAAGGRWRDSLGPHRLVRDAHTADEALAAFPPLLWWEIVAWLIRLFPGASSESYCHDYADAPSLALEKVFAEPTAELERLLLCSRSVIVSDVHAHREIRTLIGSFLGET